MWSRLILSLPSRWPPWDKTSNIFNLTHNIIFSPFQSCELSEQLVHIPTCRAQQSWLNLSGLPTPPVQCCAVPGATVASYPSIKYVQTATLASTAYNSTTAQTYCITCKYWASTPKNQWLFVASANANIHTDDPGSLHSCRVTTVFLRKLFVHKFVTVIMPRNTFEAATLRVGTSGVPATKIPFPFSILVNSKYQSTPSAVFNKYSPRQDDPVLNIYRRYNITNDRVRPVYRRLDSSLARSCLVDTV